MAHILSILSGSTTLPLSSGNITLLKYAPKTPREGALSVTETAEVLISGATVAAIQATVDALRQALRKSEEYQAHKEQLDGRAYVQFQPDGASKLGRSEILRGSVEYAEDALEFGQWGARKVQVAVFWERVPFWEDPEVQVPISNRNATNNTSGLTIWGHTDSDAGHDSWLEIAAGVVGGNLPGAARLELTNTYSGNRAYTVYIGHSARSDPGQLNIVLEGEHSLYVQQKTGSNLSGGAYGRYPIYLAGTTRAFSWQLGSEFLSHAKGNYFNLIARFTGNLPNVQIQPKVTIEHLSVLWQGRQVQTSGLKLVELGTVRLPPYLIGAGSVAPLYLDLDVRAFAGNQEICLDYLQLVPAEQWRKLEPQGYGLAYGTRLVDDGIEGLVYSDGWSGGGKLGHYVGYGSPIYLEPGSRQRLYFQWSAISGDSAMMTMSAKLFYRPRHT